MKHLHCFESFSPGYHLVSVAEFEQALYGAAETAAEIAAYTQTQYEYLTAEEETMLRTRFEEHFGQALLSNRIGTADYCHLSVCARNGALAASVYKFQDEWYYLAINFPNTGATTYYYQCDQWVGLVECIKNLPTD